MKAGQHVLWIDSKLEPECAADVGCAYADAAFVNSQRFGKLLADQMWHLSGCVHGQFVRTGAPDSDDAPRLHR